MTQTIEITAHHEAREALQRYFKEHHFDFTVKIGSHAHNYLLLKTATQHIEMNAPVRLGKLLDHCFSLCSEQIISQLNFQNGRATLDLEQSIFTTKSGKSVILTEKETDILKLLHDYDGGHVSKELLLETIWGYSKDIETHTLETHIYRLRQKIEENPSEPKILQTDEEGYFISQL